MSALGEALGFSELWISEDCFYTGGISGAAIALGATSRIQVGLGLVSAVVRHPAVLAMECATLARAFPGRFRPGIGLGLAHGLHQLELYPKSQLAAVRESIGAVRALLAGESVEQTGEAASLRGVSLAYPLSEPVPIYMGGHGPRMLRLAGEIADGLLLSIFAGEAYVRWARELALEGRAAARRNGGPGRTAVFVLYAVDADSARAKATLAPIVASFLAVMPRTSLGDVYGITGQLVELAAGGPDAILEAMPEAWLTDLCVVGDPEECAAQIRRLCDAGADSVVVFPVPADRSDETLRLTAAEVFPRLL
jgi:5,10-methylenetetrahydromethanopterin reductase